MPFIGNQPALAYTSFAKQDFTTSATTSYTLDNPVTNENEIALFINFVRQEPTTAYTASGTSLTLTSATSASDDMYCVFLGKAVQTVNPPSGSVGISQLSATGTKDSTTFLRGDNTFSTISAGITMADQWRLTANVTADVTPIASNWERIDTYSPALVGTGMSESSGVFSFPSTGIYLIIGQARFFAVSGGDVSIDFILQITTDNSTYNQLNLTQGGGNNNQSGGAFSSIIDVTDISNIKVRTSSSSVTSGSLIQGNTSDSRTSLTFIRLGDT